MILWCLRKLLHYLSERQADESRPASSRGFQDRLYSSNVATELLHRANLLASTSIPKPVPLSTFSRPP